MPTYLPGGEADKNYSEKLTFRGQGVEGLVEVFDAFVPEDADESQLATPYAQSVFYLLSRDDFCATRTALYEYLPASHETKNYSERLTLRGAEVDALREVISKIDRKDLSFNAATLIDFVMYKMRNEPIHVDQNQQELTI